MDSSSSRPADEDARSPIHVDDDFSFNRALPGGNNHPLQAASPQPDDLRIEASSEVLRALEQCGALQSTVPRPDPAFEMTELHAVFAWHNFNPEEFSYVEWNALRPALVLASLFLSEKTCLFDFFVRITHLEPFRVPEGNHFQFLYEDHDLRGVTPTMILQTKDILLRMAEVVRFCVDKQKPLHNPAAIEEMDLYQSKANHQRGDNFDGVRCADRSPFPAYQSHLGHEALPEDVFIGINMSRIWTQAIEEVGSYEAQLRRVHFGYAVTIVHELCHAVWCFTRSEEYGHIIPTGEPRYNPDMKMHKSSYDLGTQWECATFKQTKPFLSTNVRDSNSRRGQERTVLLPNGLIVDGMVYGEELPVLSSDFIDKWYSGSTWNQIRDDGWATVPTPEVMANCKVVAKKGNAAVWDLHLIEPYVLSNGVTLYPTKRDGKRKARKETPDDSRSSAEGLAVRPSSREETKRPKKG